MTMKIEPRNGRLVRVRTTQHVELTGFLAPAPAADAPLLISLHGLSGNFDTSFTYDFLQSPDLAGVHLLSIGCSGHGNIAMSRVGVEPAYKLTGSAFEYFDDCIPDLAAWMDFAARSHGGPIVLLGHSLGASKILRYAAATGDARVRGLVLASAADLRGAFFALHGEDKAAAFLDQARQLTDAGQGRVLMGEDCVLGLLRQRISISTTAARHRPSATCRRSRRRSCRCTAPKARSSAPPACAARSTCCAAMRHPRYRSRRRCWAATTGTPATKSRPPPSSPTGWPDMSRT
ncbi:MAG: hypothetical protein ABT00_19725 [Bordetella sp. SCN 68-11]|nr:MAG: hypothetical protein ABT00_19725 [Bordetella sp. SCN 68-11]